MARPKGSKGCSPETAAGIAHMLLQDRDDYGLALLIKDRQPTQRPMSQIVAAPKVKRPRKITPQIEAFVQGALGCTPAEVVTKVKAAFGVSISPGAVYKAWQRAGRRAS